MEMLIGLLVQIISGAIGGNLAGLSKLGMGTGLNTMIGGIGGVVLAQIVGAVTGVPPGGALDVAVVGSNIVGGGVGGLVLTFIVGWLKTRLATK